MFTITYHAFMRYSSIFASVDGKNNYETKTKFQISIAAVKTD